MKDLISVEMRPAQQGGEEGGEVAGLSEIRQAQEENITVKNGICLKCDQRNKDGGKVVKKGACMKCDQRRTKR